MTMKSSFLKVQSKDEAVVRIEPAEGWASVDLHELWQHRELLLYLVGRDLRALYANTGLGVLWTILQPLATAIVITIVLGIFARIPTGNIPYGLVAFSGLVVWSYFATAVKGGCESMVANANLMTKVYFPRLIIPAVPILAGLVDLAVLILVLLGAMLFYGRMPQLSWLIIPIPVILTLALALGASLWLSALNVKYRDVGRLVPLILQIGLYASPIVYPYNIIPEFWRSVYALNPVVGVVNSMRWALFREAGFPFSELLISAFVAAVLIVSGAVVFQRIERLMADIV
jgi:lipopolysaccharide transport system permease protein